MTLAKAVENACNAPSKFSFLYDLQVVNSLLSCSSKSIEAWFYTSYQCCALPKKFPLLRQR